MQTVADATGLEGRRPCPPADLDGSLRARAGHVAPGPEAADALLGAAKDALASALAQPGRVRAAAFDLLAADALVTYACEAALESDEPDAVLDRLVSIGGERDRR